MLEEEASPHLPPPPAAAPSAAAAAASGGGGDGSTVAGGEESKASGTARVPVTVVEVESTGSEPAAPPTPAAGAGDAPAPPPAPPPPQPPRQPLIDTSAAVTPDLVDAIKTLEAARVAAQKRAARFGTAYVEPDPYTILPHSTVRRLLRQKGPGESLGMDTAAQEAKGAARAARFGTAAPFSFAAQPARVAGLSDAEVALRAERRSRASRFGLPSEEDRLVAQAAAEALGTAPSSVGEVEGAPAPAPRPNVLHVRGYGYLPAATADINAYFGDYSPVYIGACLLVCGGSRPQLSTHIKRPHEHTPTALCRVAVVYRAQRRVRG